MRFPRLPLARLAGRSAALLSFSLLACSSKIEAGKGTGPVSGDSGSPKGKGGDWTMLGYDLGSTYWNQAETKISTTTAPNLTKAWEFDFGAGASVVATPVISGGKVYVQSQLPAVSAIDLATGKELWRNADIGGTATPALSDGVLYINDGAGIVHALDPSAGGKEIWKSAPLDAWVVGFSSPVVTKDYVLVGTSGLEEVTKIAGAAQTRGYVLALHKKDGTVAWKKFTVDPPATGVGIWSTLSVDEAAGLVVAGTGNNYTGTAGDTSDAFLGMPLDQPADGAALLWHPQIFQGDVSPNGTGPDGDFGADPILFDVGGQKLAAGGTKKGDVWVIDRTTGTIITQRNLGGPGSAFKGGIFVNGAWDGKSLLFASNLATSTGAGSEPPQAGVPVGTLFALDPLTLAVNWERQFNGAAWGMISVANGVGFFGKDKTLQAFDTATGAMLLEFPTEGSIATAPSVSDGYVVFGSGMSWLGGSTAGTKYYALKVP